MAEAQRQGAESGIAAGSSSTMAAEIQEHWTRLAAHWDGEAARALLASSEGLLDAPDALVAARAGDLAAFLAAFIDESEPPTEAQRERVGQLTAALRGAMAGSSEPSP